MAFSGVRISWLMAARKRPFASLARLARWTRSSSSACSRHRSVRSRMTRVRTRPCGAHQVITVTSMGKHRPPAVTNSSSRRCGVAGSSGGSSRSARASAESRSRLRQRPSGWPQSTAAGVSSRCSAEGFRSSTRPAASRVTMPSRAAVSHDPGRSPGSVAAGGARRFSPRCRRTPQRRQAAPISASMAHHSHDQRRAGALPSTAVAARAWPWGDLAWPAV